MRDIRHGAGDAVRLETPARAGSPIEEVDVNNGDVDRRFRGLSGVAITPFDDAGRVDVDGVEATAAFLVEEGVDVLVVCGNTGEFHALSDAEARTVVEASVRAVHDRRIPLVVGVGGSAQTARAAAAHAGESGADAVMVHHPTHPFVTGRGLHAYYRTVAEAGLPIIPYVKSPVVTTEDIVRIVAEPWIPAVKYAVNDLPAFAAVGAAAGGRADVVWICGTAERWAPFFFAAGADGFTSGLVNVTAALSRALLEALAAGDRDAARSTWAAILPFETLRSRSGDGFNVSVVKEAVRRLGRPAGPVRPPASEVGLDEQLEIDRFLRAAGLVDAAVA